MTSRTLRWRGVRPVSSAGPSGISRTLLLVAMTALPRSFRAWTARFDCGDGNAIRRHNQTHVRSCLDFVGAMGYNFDQTFDRTTVRPILDQESTDEHSDDDPPEHSVVGVRRVR